VAEAIFIKDKKYIKWAVLHQLMAVIHKMEINKKSIENN
jgi:hypothetical protein